LVKKNLAAYEYPRKIEFVRDLPRITGKIKRHILRKLEEKKQVGGDVHDAGAEGT
jgi:acyl-coenzyme A synthetase/AMP-(fatty) acid ligase